MEQTTPLEGIGEVVKDERGRAETEREAGIEVERTEPVKTKKGPIGRSDGTKTEGMLDIEFGHEGSIAGCANEGDGVVE